MSAIDVPVISALSLQPASAAKPASAAIPDSTATPASAAIPTSQQYVQTGERAPKLSTVPSRQEVLRVMEVLLLNGTPFKPIDVVHVSLHQSFTTLFKRKFTTDPDRRDSCNDWKHWSNQLFCRELNITVPTSAVNRTDKLSFIETVSQVAVQFDLKNKSVEDKTDQLLADIVEAYPDATSALQLQATKILIENWQLSCQSNLSIGEQYYNVVLTTQHQDSLQSKTFDSYGLRSLLSYENQLMPYGSLMSSLCMVITLAKSKPLLVPL